MKITIGHLFYDLLTLYGESGNINALVYHLKEQGIDVVVKKISLEDELDLDELDFIYIGAGSENNQKNALTYLMQYKEKICKAIKDNKFILATGNSIELFGKCIKDETTKEEFLALNVFYYTSLHTKKRIVNECIFKCDLCQKNVIGFQNQQGYITDAKSPLFSVIKGFGNKLNEGVEGYQENNFYGTYLLGPVLARNPEFLEYLIKSIILSKDKDFTFRNFEFNIETKAYTKYLEKYNR